MATLERVIEMQGKGATDQQIIEVLRNEGISPKEIEESLNQARVKSAVAGPENLPGRPPMPQTPGQNPQSPIEGMQPSMMPNSSEQSQATQGLPQQPAAPAPQTPAPEVYPPQAQMPQAPAPQQPQEEYYTPAPNYPQDQPYYQQQEAVNPDTIAEIAEQVIADKLAPIKKKVEENSSFKNSIQEKVIDIDERLKRIENSIDKLQQAIIGKIGEFGESSAAIHQDLDNLHDTMGKMMNPLMDNYNELKKIAGKK